MYKVFPLLQLCSFAIVLIGQPPQSPKPAAQPKATISFHLSQGWTEENNVMDSIWKPLGLHGVNHYAFGGPANGKLFASRSDPASPLYQAWLGAYTVTGGRNLFASADENANIKSVLQLAELDQKSWLGAMGDPAPLATSALSNTVSTIEIDGAQRRIYSFDMESHSDLSESGTDLAKAIGMPPAAYWKPMVNEFHPVTLHIQYTFWYDARRNSTIVLYGASAAFRSKNGEIHDNRPALSSALLTMIRTAHVE